MVETIVVIGKDPWIFTTGRARVAAILIGLPIQAPMDALFGPAQRLSLARTVLLGASISPAGCALGSRG